MRHLIAKVDPRAGTISLQDLIDLGLTLVGLHAFQELVYKGDGVDVPA